MTCTQMSQEEDNTPFLRYEPCCTGYKCIYLSVALSVVAIVLTIVGVSLGIVQVSWLAGHITGSNLHSDSVFTNIINVEKEAHIGNLTSSKKRDLGQDSSPNFAFYVNTDHIIHSVKTFFLEYAFFKDATFENVIFEELNSQKAYIKELEVKILKLEDVNANKVETNILEVFESVLLANGIDLEVLGDLTADYGFFNFQVEALAGYFNLLDAALINATSMTALLGNFTAGITIRYDWQVVGCQPRYASTILITVRDGPSPAPIYGDTVDIYVTECEHGSILFLFDFGITTFFPIAKSTRTTILFDEPFCDRLIMPQGFQLYGKTSGVGADVDQPTSFYYDAAVGVCGFSSTQTITQAGSSQISLAFVLP